MGNDFFDELISYKEDRESHRQFAKRLGVHPSMLKYWEKSMQPKKETLEKIAKVLLPREIRREWVRWALSNSHDPAPKAETLPVPMKTEEVRLEQARQSNDIFLAVPVVLPYLRDGQVCLSHEDSWFMFRRDWAMTVGTDPTNLWLKIVWERCMAPSLQPSDVVLIDAGRVGLTDGGVYAVNIDGIIMLRRMTLLPGGRVRLSSDNGSKVIEGYREELGILGEVVWMGRTL